MTLKVDVKFEGKQFRDVKSYVRNWVNFHGNSQKSACKDLDEKLQKSYVS